MKKHLSNIVHIFLLFIFVIFLLCCKKTEISTTPYTPTTPTVPAKPLAGFDFVVKNQRVLPDALVFTNSSTNATTYAWTFDDGNVFIQPALINIYKAAKTYNVKLVVTGIGGSDSITKAIIIILEKPKADFSFVFQNGGTPPTKVLFTNNSFRANSVLCRFDDGIVSRVVSPENEFKQSKIFTMKLFAYNASGIDSFERKATIAPSINSVLVFLITPIDKPFNQDYYNILKSTALHIQAFYKTQMGVKPFSLNNPIVDTLKGLHNYAWYNNDNGVATSGNDPRFYGYYNTLNEISKLITTNLSSYTYIFYIAAPGGGAGKTSQAALGDQDLDGLLLEQYKSNKRWIGCSAHESGHAFELPHPDNQLAIALMWT